MAVTNRIVVESKTQRIVVDPSTASVQVNAPTSVAVVLGGPPGPRGDSVIPIPESPGDDGKAPVADGGEYILEQVLRSDDFSHAVKITQAEYDALPIPRDPSIVYFITET